MSSSELVLDTFLNDDLFGEFNENEDPEDIQKRSNNKIENKEKGRFMRFFTSPVLKKKKKTMAALLILFLFSCLFFVVSIYVFSQKKISFGAFSLLISFLLGFTSCYNFRMVFNQIAHGATSFNQIPDYDEL
ncbi:hypothetical protein M0813_16540 [Anaeramoeba flamelloides]|uniref:Transmembrane protein 230 n=1 Tax=Anaeramoeba flamelloides TaxID=1746091 RepID=A0ABQ8YYY0_9EUKA|nr:hypothetical protein M0813_16540 [Anaeramoeba flamelloides]